MSWLVGTCRTVWLQASQTILVIGESLSATRREEDADPTKSVIVDKDRHRKVSKLVSSSNFVF